MKPILLLALLSIVFFSCKKEPVEKVCPLGYTGPNCNQQITPTNIIIHSITVTKFPLTDSNGAGWDLTSGPDVYITISQNGNEIFTTKSSWVQNASPGVTFNKLFALPDVTGVYTISVYDYDDFDADDYMGGVFGVLYSSNNGFPTTLAFGCPSCSVGFSINMSYTF